MYNYRRFLSRPMAKTALVVGTFSLLASAPQTAFASFNITDIANFNGSNPASGKNPESGVTIDSSGNLFGTTQSGGADNFGAVYEVATGTNTITDIASFNSTNGQTPNATLTLDNSGNIFGTTTAGGVNGYGTVYEIAAGTSTITDLGVFSYDFSKGYANGINPYGGVTIDGNGNLFGTTISGGSGNRGVVYEIVSGSNTITDIASFNTTNGSQPYAGVTLDSSGNIFGTTRGGGANSFGTVYEIVAGSHTINDLVAFSGTNGNSPYGGITLDSDGNLYGTTQQGGANGSGTVFEVAHGTSNLTTLVSFNNTNGKFPNSGVTLDGNGDIFGTAAGGGANISGTVYQITKGSNAITSFASFTGLNGSGPNGGVAFDSSGNLFGTTFEGGANNSGTVYEVVGAGAPVPEASAALSLGLLLTLGGGGLLRRNKKK